MALLELPPVAEEFITTDADPLERSPAPASADPDDAAWSAADLPQSEQQALLSALLFTSGEALAETRLCSFMGKLPQELELLVEESSASLRTVGLDILKAAGAYRLVTAAQWDGPLRLFFRQVRKSKLSRNALEILSVIAYEQPVTRVRIDELRQANSESAVRSLLERRLITVAGREDGPGKAFKYKTTPAFLELFGLSSLADLPPKPVSFNVEQLDAAAMEGAEEAELD